MSDPIEQFPLETELLIHSFNYDEGIEAPEASLQCNENIEEPDFALYAQEKPRKTPSISYGNNFPW